MWGGCGGVLDIELVEEVVGCVARCGSDFPLTRCKRDVVLVVAVVGVVVGVAVVAAVMSVEDRSVARDGMEVMRGSANSRESCNCFISWNNLAKCPLYSDATVPTPVLVNAISTESRATHPWQ